MHDPMRRAWFLFNFCSIVSSKNNLAKLFPIVFLIVKLAKSKNYLKVSISQKQSVEIWKALLSWA
jgi:hypothetical protein